LKKNATPFPRHWSRTQDFSMGRGAPWRPLLSFEAALRRTRRIPQTAQTGYLMGIRLERYVAEGLRKLARRGA
jgi:hypothetical protein